MDSFCIYLENDFSHFEPGQQVHGRLSLQCAENIGLESLCVQFVGVAKTEWKLGETYMTGNSAYIDNVPYTSELNYTRPEPVVLDVKSLSAGQNVIPFQLNLPGDVPPSFENCLGCIRYWIKAVAEFKNQSQKVAATPIGICSNSAAALSENLKDPVRRESKKELNKLFHKHGQIHAAVTVNKSAYVVGESIAVKVEVSNQSDKSLSDIHLQLVQISHYSAQRDCTRPNLRRQKDMQYKQDEIVVKEWDDSLNVAKMSNAVYEDVLRVPEVIPTFNNCEILQVNYVLRAKFLSPAGKILLTSDVPVQIGSYSNANSLRSSASDLSEELTQGTESSFLPSTRPISSF